MSKADTWESGVIKLLLQNVDFTGLGDAGGVRGSAVAGTIYISLHTSDPGEAGDQTTNEASYTGYARKGVTRSTGEFSESGGVGTNINAQLFNLCTGGSATITHWGLGTASSGAGKLLYSGALPSSLAVSNNIQPNVAAGALTITET